MELRDRVDICEAIDSFESLFLRLAGWESRRGGSLGGSLELGRGGSCGRGGSAGDLFGGAAGWLPGRIAELGALLMGGMLTVLFRIVGGGGGFFLVMMASSKVYFGAVPGAGVWTCSRFRFAMRSRMEAMAGVADSTRTEADEVFNRAKGGGCLLRGGRATVQNSDPTSLGHSLTYSVGAAVQGEVTGNTTRRIQGPVNHEPNLLPLRHLPASHCPAKMSRP